MTFIVPLKHISGSITGSMHGTASLSEGMQSSDLNFDLVLITGSTIVTGSLSASIFIGNNVLLDNNSEYSMKDTSGTSRVVATLNDSNILIFGPVSGITETRIRAGTSDYISMNVGSSQVVVTNFLYNSIRNSNGLIDHYYASNLHTGSLAASRYLILFSDTSGSTVNGGYWRTGKGGSWTPNTSSQNGNMTWGVAHTGSITEKMVLTTSSFIPHVNVDLDTVGTGIKIKEGTNATLGVVTLVAGAATVSTTKVTASSRIFLTKQTNPVAGSSVSIHTRSAGTSFGISSSNAADTADVAWMIIEPSP